MTVKRSIQDCFRELVTSASYEEISVTLICRKANVSRASFYDIFENKEAILASIVIEDVVNPLHLILETISIYRFESLPQIMMELIYQGIREHREFYLRINRVERGSLLVRILTERLIVVNNTVLKDFDLPEDEKSYAAFFFSAANANLISHWLSNKTDLDPTRLAHLFNKWTLSYWQKASPVKQGWLSAEKI